MRLIELFGYSSGKDFSSKTYVIPWDPQPAMKMGRQIARIMNLRGKWHWEYCHRSPRRKLGMETFKRMIDDREVDAWHEAQEISKSIGSKADAPSNKGKRL